MSDALHVPKGRKFPGFVQVAEAGPQGMITLRGDLAAHIAGQIVVALARGRLGTRIGRLAHMKIVRSGRVDTNDLGQARLVDHVLKDALRSGGTADITRTDEKYFIHDR